jgi:tetratricopeptide (TPR) repeat protein
MKKILILATGILLTGCLFGQSAFDYILKAKACTETGKTDQAVVLLTEAINKTRESSLFIERAETEMLRGNYSAAISDFNAANDITPLSGEFGLSKIYSLKGDVATAMYHLERNLKSSFKKSEKEILLEPSFGTVENRPEWRSFWKKDWYNEKEKSVAEIEYYTALGKINESKEVLTELKTAYAEGIDISYSEALVDMAAGNFSEVIRLLGKLLADNPANEKYLRIMAKAQNSLGNSAGASETYTQMLSHGITDARIYLQRAECYRKTGETDKAITDIEKYLDLYPGNKSALSLAGKVEVASGDNLKALQYFSENLKLNPGDADCYIDRANSYFNSKSWNLAANDFSMSLDLKPDNPDIWLSKGIALLNSGKSDDACHDFRKAMSLGNKKASEYISRSCIK